MAGPLFPDAGPEETIAAITPVESGRRLSIRVGRHTVAKLSPDAVARLGLEAGAPWTADVARRVEAEVRRARAGEIAQRAALQRPRTRREVTQILLAEGVEPPLAEQAAAEAERLGLVNDRAVAEGVVHTQLSRGPMARARLVEQLLERGVDAELAERVVADAMGGRSDADAALELARKRVRAIPASLGRDAAGRRLFGVLARRGFDESIATEAVERALRERPDLAD